MNTLSKLLLHILSLEEPQGNSSLSADFLMDSTVPEYTFEKERTV